MKALPAITALLIVCGVAAAVLQIAPSHAVEVHGFWWENPLPQQRVPEGLKTIRASECGACHVEIYREWQASIHAHALSDLQFQEEMAKDPGSGWLCLNCHIPVANQREFIAVEARGGKVNQPEFVRNRDFDPVLRQEAITCATCHVRDGTILGPWGDTQAPHPVRKSEALLSSETCTACHQAVADYGESLVCFLETGEEWQRGPFAAAGVTCIDCHMPAVTRPIADGGPPRRSGRHVWAGSRIPKELDTPLEQRRYLEAFPLGLEFDITPDKTSYSPGETAMVTLSVSNARAGHMLPTGDVERFITIDVESLGSSGEVLGKEMLRIGQLWEWYPEVKKLSDNRLAPGEGRSHSFAFVLPDARGPVRFRAQATNHRLSEENAAYHGLTGRYPLSAPLGVVEKEVRIR